MMKKSFWINALHYFLSFTKRKQEPEHLAGLRFFNQEVGRPCNVVESVSVRREILSSNAGAVMEGISSYTESLGFESSDQLNQETSSSRSRRKKKEIACIDSRSEEVKNGVYPPRLNWNGRPSSYLKPVRKDGRLVVTQVTFNRPPQLLRASRQDGRLRLYLHEPVSNPQVKESMVVEEETLKPLVRKDGADGFVRRCAHRSIHNHLPLWSTHRVNSVF